jgi:hypothetical protein
VFSSPSLREGAKEGEEGVAAVVGVVEFTIVVAEEDDDDEPVKVKPVPESPPRRLVYKQASRIRIGPRG